MPLLSPRMLTLHPASSLPFIWIRLEIRVGLRGYLEHLVNFFLLGALFSFLQESGMQNTYLHFFLCRVTWPAFGKRYKCRIRVGSFSPRNFLCGDFFV
jgi:hypothetical protein